MPVPDMIRNVTRNVREALSSREGFKEKAKELPLYVIQTTLSGVGQMLLLGDRVRNTLKRVTGQTEEVEETEKAGDTGETARRTAGEEAEGRPARREPVIFAPRPEATEPTDAEKAKVESNGTKTRPEPVIFAPAKPKPAAREAAPAAEPPADAVTGTAADTPAPAEPPAEPKARKAGAAVTEPAGVRVEVTEVETTGVDTAAPEPAEAAAVEVVETGVAEPSAPASAVPAEPMPGYGGLTVASLRARMRGKSAEQIGELLAYEQATTARPEVVRMYENRLAKLEAAE